MNEKRGVRPKPGDTRLRPIRGTLAALASPNRPASPFRPAGLRPAAPPSRWTVHPPSRLRRRSPIAARDSGSGTPAAPAGDRLRLLPSGPDLVHKPTPRGDPSHRRPERRSNRSETPLGGEFSPARADCGCRAPLPPRLARSTVDPSARRRPARFPSQGRTAPPPERCSGGLQRVVHHKCVAFR